MSYKTGSLELMERDRIRINVSRLFIMMYEVPYSNIRKDEYFNFDINM